MLQVISDISGMVSHDELWRGVAADELAEGFVLVDAVGLVGVDELLDGLVDVVGGDLGEGGRAELGVGAERAAEEDRVLRSGTRGNCRRRP